MEYNEGGINSKANAGLTTGIIGTALGVLNGGMGLLGNGVGYHTTEGGHYVTKDELNYVQEISAKNSEIALLKAEQDSEKKMVDIYERVMTRVNADQRAQADVNAAQAVYNATSSSAVAVLQNQVNVLNSLTKTVVPITSVCPQPMPQYNSWTAPTTGSN